MSTVQNFNFQNYPKYDLLGLFLYRTGMADLHGWNIINTNAAVTYVQLFNAASVGAVTLGTTPPTFVIAVAAGAGISDREFLNEENRLSFPLGLVAAATTTPTGNTAPGAAIVTNLFIN